MEQGKFDSFSSQHRSAGSWFREHEVRFYSVAHFWNAQAYISWALSVSPPKLFCITNKSFEISFYFLCIGFYLHVFLCTTCMPGSHGGIRCPGTRVLGSRETQCRCLESNLSSVWEQRMLLTILLRYVWGPFLQPSHIPFSITSYSTS